MRTTTVIAPKALVTRSNARVSANPRRNNLPNAAVSTGVDIETSAAAAQLRFDFPHLMAWQGDVGIGPRCSKLETFGHALNCVRLSISLESCGQEQANHNRPGIFEHSVE
jgi:hypothetical protein